MVASGLVPFLASRAVDLPTDLIPIDSARVSSAVWAFGYIETLARWDASLPSSRPTFVGTQ
jgi:hypothetical protein